MPAGDRTGPMGMGPMTGRGAGYCAGYATPGYLSPVPGRGYGMGWGRGRAWGGMGRGRGWRGPYFRAGLPGWAHFGYGPVWGAVAPGAYGYGAVPSGPSPEQEVEFLKSQANWLQEQLAAIDSRLKELEQEG